MVSEKLANALFSTITSVLLTTGFSPRLFIDTSHESKVDTIEILPTVGQLRSVLDLTERGWRFDPLIVSLRGRGHDHQNGD